MADKQCQPRKIQPTSTNQLQTSTGIMSRRRKAPKGAKRKGRRPRTVTKFVLTEECEKKYETGLKEAMASLKLKSVSDLATFIDNI